EIQDRLGPRFCNGAYVAKRSCDLRYVRAAAWKSGSFDWLGPYPKHGNYRRECIGLRNGRMERNHRTSQNDDGLGTVCPDRRNCGCRLLGSAVARGGPPLLGSDPRQMG